MLIRINVLYQMIANTKVPPPPIIGDNLAGLNQPPCAVPFSLQQSGSIVASPLQQHYQMQQQLIQQQRQQQSNVFEVTSKPKATEEEQSGSFEIGTFDPNAYEVSFLCILCSGFLFSVRTFRDSVLVFFCLFKILSSELYSASAIHDSSQLYIFVH